MRTKTLLTALATAGLLAGSAQAAVILPITATASSNFSGRTPTDAVDGTGLSGGLHGTDATTMWLTSGGMAGQYIEFDLGAVYTIDSFDVWNYNEAASNGSQLAKRGINGVTITYGTASSAESTLTEVTNFALVPVAANNNGLPDLAAETFDVTNFDAQFIRFTVVSNYNGSGFTGLSEVQFTQVPEPGSLALLGLGGLCVLRRRRG